MADALSSVAPDVQERTKALLTAVAQGGTAGLQAYKATEDSMKAARQQSIDRASQLGGLIGGPEAQGFESVAAGQYDRRLADNAIASNSFAADMARRGGAQKSYLDQVAASVPLVRADTERQLAAYKAKVDASASKAAAEDELSDSELRTRLLGGADNKRDEMNAAFDSEIEANTNPVDFGNRPMSFMTPKGLTAMTPKGIEAKTGKSQLANTTQSQIAHALGEAGGYGSDWVRGLLGATAQTEKATNPDETSAKNIAKWAKTDPKTAAKIAVDQTYRSVRSQAVNFLNYPTDDKGKITGGTDYDGKTPWEAYLLFARAYTSGKPRTYAALVGELSGLFSASKAR